MELVESRSGPIEFRLIPGREARPALVFLHDGIGSAGLWRDFPDRVAAATGAPALVYSRHGHGRSARLAAPRGVDYMHREALEALPEILDRLAIDMPVLIGHSDGASIALIHAGSGVRPVRGLALIAPHVFVEERTIAGIRAASDEWQAGGLAERLGRHHDDAAATFRGWSDIWLSPSFRLWNIEAMLPAIACPILLVQGEADEYGTLAQLAAIRRAASCASLTEVILPGCGHTPQREQPEATLAAITAFVTGLA